MTKVTNTLSSMVMAAPLAVAAPSTLPPDASAQQFEVRDSASTVSIAMQSHGDRQLHGPDRVKTRPNHTPPVAEWYGAHSHPPGQSSSIANRGVTPTIRRLDDGRLAWYVEDGKVGHQSSVTDNAGGRCWSTIYGHGDHRGAMYTTISGVDIGSSLQHHPATGYRHPDSAVSTASLNPQNGTWTWTQKA